ncbi:hypothetical protein EMPS_01514 [Entomortierella parvispora]|uniref:Uncharacterized protein n=1 Tax=Entomortierella parvispora TaxID=205924 RepID=A0A9P3H314_9FUNG|nr:hypothetical protein EMPS_01514 [Entomortierella parvispora]
MAMNVPSVSREDNSLSPVDPDSDYNRYRNRSQEEQVLDYIPPPPSQPTALGNALNRSRRTQRMGGYLSKLPPASSSDESSASFSSNSNSRTSSTSSVNDLPPSQPVYVLSDKPVPKSKPKTTKGFRSKLSKQYTPSDDESDEEPLGIKVLAFPAPPPSPTAPLSPPLPGMSHARSSMFMSGRAVELNSDCGAVSRSDRNFGSGTATESLRVVSMNDATMPSLAVNTTMDRMETASLSSKTKKCMHEKRTNTKKNKSADGTRKLRAILS